MHNDAVYRLRIGDKVSFNGVLIGVEEVDLDGLNRVLLIHGTINGETTIFYLAIDDVERFISRGMGVSLNGVGVVSSTDPLVIKSIEVSGV